MTKVLLPLIVASGLATAVTAWGYGRVAYDGRRILGSANANYATFSPKTTKLLTNKRFNNGRCWYGSGISVDVNHVWFTDFCSNNGYITRCPKFNYNSNSFGRCTAVARVAGYGGMALSPLGGKLQYLARAARDSAGRPSNSYNMGNMKWCVWGTTQQLHKTIGRCYYGIGISDMQLVDQQKGWMLFLNSNPRDNYPNANMRACKVGTGQQSGNCRCFRSHTVRKVCGSYKTIPKGMTYVASRRRVGFLYFSCQGVFPIVYKHKFDWSHVYKGVDGTVKTTTSTTTTTTTTPVPITMKTWSFPEGISWTIRKGRKTICTGGRYTDWYTSLKVTGCKLSKGWYTVTCKDRFKEGWHGAYLQIHNRKLCHKNFEWGKGPVMQAKFFIKK